MLITPGFADAQSASSTTRCSLQPPRPRPAGILTLVSTTPTALRPAGDQFPARLRDEMDARLGGIGSATVQPGGFTPGMAARLQLANGTRVFAKGIPVSHVLAGKYRAEAVTCRQLPAATPAPRLRWDSEIADWVVLVFDDIDGRHPDLSPGSHDVGHIVAMTAALGPILTPCPVTFASAASAELTGRRARCGVARRT